MYRASPFPDVPVEPVHVDAKQVQILWRAGLGENCIKGVRARGLYETIQRRDPVVGGVFSLQFLELFGAAFDLETTPILVVQQVPGIAVELAVPSAKLDAIAVGRSDDLEDLLDDAVFAALRGDLAGVLAQIGGFRFDP